MNSRIEEYFIITRDTEDLKNEIKMRQCWTGERWSKDIDDVLVYDSLMFAMSDHMELNFSTHTRYDIPPSGFALHPADIRQIKESDIQDGWNVLTVARMKKGSEIDANNFCELYGVTKNDVLETRMTPREKLVMMLLSGGMSVAEIVRQGNVRALEGKKQPVSAARVHQIKSKALRKIRQRIGT